MATTHYYAPATISHINSRDVIENAYLAAGLTPPSSVDALSELLANEMEPHEVAARYANKSIDGKEPAEKLLEDALQAWQRAQAAESFRATYDRVVDALANERISELRDAALKVLDKPFKALTKRLAAAAEMLDANSPLDRDVAFQQDTSAQLKEAEAILTTLSHYRITSEPTLIGSASALLPIVTIPDIEQEEITRSTMGDIFTTPADAASQQRNQVRAMLNAAEKDLDTTIINIARGQWEGISLSLANDDEMQRRATAHHNATVRKSVADRNLDNLVRVI